MNHLFCFGLGYSAKVFGKRLKAQGWTVTGTSRSSEGLATLAEMGFDAILFNSTSRSEDVANKLSNATHILTSIPPAGPCDPVLQHYAEDIIQAKSQWIGYLSTVGVYGNWDGAWIDESNERRPKSERSKNRTLAEDAWLALVQEYDLPVHVFRLSGIYGPGRNAIRNLKRGTARRLEKPGQVFNRIHVDDIANVLEASVAKPNAGGVYNVTDSEPAPPQDVVTYAAELINMEPPPWIPFEKADLSPMARSFYGENKRVRNTRIHDELGVTLSYPTYREGLQALAKD